MILNITGLPEKCATCTVFEKQWELIPPEGSPDNAYPMDICPKFAAIAFVGLVNANWPKWLNSNGQRMNDNKLPVHAELLVREFTEKASECATSLANGDESLATSESMYSVADAYRELEYM